MNDLLARNREILKAKASRTSLQGVAVAFAAVIVATLMVTYAQGHSITLDGIVRAQHENFVLRILDVMPFVFGYLGQYGSYVVAQQASLLVQEQTQDLREHADWMELQATFAATHDLLTDLPNKQLFYARLEQAIQSNDSMLAVVMVAIDNLKEIQSTLGTANSDLVIKQLVTRLTSWSGEKDSVARIDNHRFAILLSECTDHEEPLTAARNLIKAIEPYFVVNTLKLTLQPSIGIAIYPDHGGDADTLIQRAGIAENFAGSAFSNFSIYSPTMDEQSSRRLTLIGDLKGTLERDELELYFQPKLSLADNSVIGVEALLRWKHDEHGFISPDEFISLAERHRIIRPLSDWVLERAFRQSAIWQRDGRELIVSINLSTKDLNDPGLPDQIAGMLARTGADPWSIMFEITEGSIMSDPARVLVIAERLRGMGFQFSVDDFGTGYSSLSYLKKLPISELKIDKSFVMDMQSSLNDRVIVRATVDLAHNLGLKVTAEGIENAEALSTLQSYGCDIGQGYLFSKPLPIAELEAWLSSDTGIQ